MSHQKPTVREAIIVEGRYDKNTLSQVVDAVIVETHGFGVFDNAELAALLRRLNDTCGVIVFTDSDSAGFQIRNHIKSILGTVKHAYIPDIPGKERRKRAPSKSGTLGVEGMPPEVILAALISAGATFEDVAPTTASPSEPLTKYDLYALGLSGTADAAQRRSELLQTLGLPHLMSANALLEVLNTLYSRDELTAILNAQDNN